MVMFFYLKKVAQIEYYLGLGEILFYDDRSSDTASQYWKDILIRLKKVYLLAFVKFYYELICIRVSMSKNGRLTGKKNAVSMLNLIF